MPDVPDRPLDPRDRTPEDPGDGLRFSHVVEMQTKQKLAELSASFYALIETMIASGTLPIDDYERRRQSTMKREVERAREEASVTLSEVADKYALTNLPEIDCESRLHLCHARCCTLGFPLSVQDLDERVVRWDYGRPYQIARRSDGYCVHNKAGSCTCTIYEKRPATCRTYDCRKDTRIWVDFEKRIAAQ